MPTVAILNSHPVSVLKKEISKTNIKGYSKMNKPELIVLMMKVENKPRFHHIKMREGKSAAAPKVVAEKKMTKEEKQWQQRRDRLLREREAGRKKGKKKQKSITLEQVKANLANSYSGKMFKAADEMIKNSKSKNVS